MSREYSVFSIQCSEASGALRAPECAPTVSSGLNTEHCTLNTSRAHLSTRKRTHERAFTMIEIALSLAVIGFALVAIIGILPTGMNAQKDNREETIICQDMSIFMNAIRNGAQGVDDLTNYVVAITNWATDYPGGAQRVYGYTRTASTSYNFPLSSGNRIIGLLSTPKYMMASNSTPANPVYTSNYVVAYVKAISGGAYEKWPQTNSEVADAGFQYRMVSEVVPYTYYNPMWTNYADPTLNPTNDAAIIQARLQTAEMVTNRQANLYDLRLLFRWPYFPGSGNVGPQRQVFRTITGGFLMNTNDGSVLGGDPVGVSNLFFFEPRNYMRPS